MLGVYLLFETVVINRRPVLINGYLETSYPSSTTLLVLWMATFLQPELFADIDMIEEVKYYYSEFYEFELTDEQAQNVIDGWVIDDE
mgnify:CR=1 FL=1